MLPTRQASCCTVRHILIVGIYTLKSFCRCSTIVQSPFVHAQPFLQYLWCHNNAFVPRGLIALQNRVWASERMAPTDENIYFVQYLEKNLKKVELYRKFADKISCVLAARQGDDVLLSTPDLKRSRSVTSSFINWTIQVGWYLVGFGKKRLQLWQLLLFIPYTPMLF